MKKIPIIYHMKKIIFLIFLHLFILEIYSISYTTTATSISWSGAYTSIADGFESMLYNPAGLYMTNRRFGLNVFGSYGFRVYNNTLSTDHFFKIYNSTDGNITSFISERLNGMTNMGFDTGFDLSMFNFMFYIKYEKFSFGFSFLPKTYLKFTISKSLFEALGQKLDLTKPLNLKFTSSFLQYLDLNINLSTRPKFIEKSIPVEAIYAGVTGHFYFPTILLNLISTGTIKEGTPNSTGFSTFDVGINGELNVGGLVPHILSQTGLDVGSLGVPDGAKNNVNSLIKNSQSTGFGLGLDMGFIIKFNKIIKLGVSATDIGFIAIPQSTKSSINMTRNLDLMNIQNFTGTISEDIINSLGNITNNTG
ncbi:MAG TPA: DUF5723 family protein, partial [Spirochaetota bacterium]|nr:DUF5723 family protein [Spirochaetota bacterium]